MQKHDLVSQLYKIQAIKLGSFQLKSGITSPVYIDLRQIVSYPGLVRTVAQAMWSCVNDNAYDAICGVPYTALPIATCVSLDQNLPMLMYRKEQKDYGTKKRIEGVYQPGDRCLVVEDVITSGGSVLTTAQCLQEEGLIVTDIVVFMDREQGGKEELNNHGFNVHSVFTLSKFLKALRQNVNLSTTELEAIDSILGTPA